VVGYDPEHERPFEKALGGICISSWRKQEVDGVSGRINRRYKLGPFACHSTVINTPRAIGYAKFAATAPFQLWGVPLNPTPDGDGIESEIALRHQLFDAPQAEGKREITANTNNDDVTFEMSTLEQCRPLPLHRPRGHQIRRAALQQCPHAGFHVPANP
jgi:hypothetical protein